MKVIPKHRVDALITENWKAWGDEKDRLDLKRLLDELEGEVIDTIYSKETESKQADISEVIDDVWHRLKHRAFTINKDWLSLEGIKQELDEMKVDKVPSGRRE